MATAHRTQHHAPAPWSDGRETRLKQKTEMRYRSQFKFPMVYRWTAFVFFTVASINSRATNLLCFFTRQNNAQKKQRPPSFPTSFKTKLGHEDEQVIMDVTDFSRGDAFRARHRIRPSLHPVTINALSGLLLSRSKKFFSNQTSSIHRALLSGRLAADAISKRQLTSSIDGMKLTQEEQQTIAGRVVGVALRLGSLEASLQRKCSNQTWIAKHHEWTLFGILPKESESSCCDELHKKIMHDPLFRINRAECLLALFLNDVEAPELLSKNVTVPDQSNIDFLDDERRKVLLEALIFF